MKIIANKPFKVALAGRNGKTRIRWQVKFRTIPGNKVITTKTYETRQAANLAIPDLLKKYQATAGKTVHGERKRFTELVELAEASFYGEAVIRQGRKTQGVRSHGPKRSELKVLSEFFGDYKLTDIADVDLYSYREWRLTKGSRRGKANASNKPGVSLSTVNRELSCLRRLLNYALGQGWIDRNPFMMAKGIIDAGAEVERTRVLSKEEEAVLLEVCEPEVKDVPTKRKRTDGSTITIPVKSGNAELKAAILFALDCGLRRGEILKLSWEDINIDSAVATIIATHTKTQKERQVPLSDRLIVALKSLPTYQNEANVFRTGDIKRSWNSARRLSGLEDVRFHDLRGTAASRMIGLGVPLAIVGKTLGHQNLSTTQRHYVRVDEVSLDDVRRRMNDFNSSTERATDAVS